MRCNCCLSDKIVLHPIDKREFHRCRNCGLVFKSRESNQNPQKQIQNHYQSQDPHRRVADSKRSFFNFALDHLSKEDDINKSLLDVGCGFGYFLEMAVNRGWKVQGVEVTPDAARRSREIFGGKNIFQGMLKEANLPDCFFDAVTLWDVLVFVDDPFEDLKECCRIMKPQAAIGIRVRNVYFQKMAYWIYAFTKPLTRRFGIKAPYVFHPYCFSAGALEQLLRRAGFENIQISNSPLTHGDPYSHAEVLGIAHLAKMLVAFVVAAIFKASFGKWVVGPSLLVWARKPWNRSQNDGKDRTASL